MAYRPNTKHNRNEELVQFYMENRATMSLDGIGKKFNISRQRVSQILKNYGLDKMEMVQDIRKTKVIGNLIDKNDVIAMKIEDLKSQRNKKHLEILNLKNIIKYRDTKIEKLEKINNDLKQENKNLEGRVKVLENTLKSLRKTLSKGE